MAKIKLNSALQTIRGRVGDVVFKHYDYGVVVTRVPRMENVRFSAAQRAHQQRVKEAGAFYRQVKADPQLNEKYSRIAARRKIPLSAVTLEVFMKQARAQAEASAVRAKSATAAKARS